MIAHVRPRLWRPRRDCQWAVFAPGRGRQRDFRVGARTLHLDSNRRREGVITANSQAAARACRSQCRSADLAPQPRLQQARQSDLERQWRVSSCRIRNAHEVGAGLNWSPVQANRSRQLDPRGGRALGPAARRPTLETSGTRVFDFTAARPSGQCDYRRQSRSRCRPAQRVQARRQCPPTEKIDLRLRADYVRTRSTAHFRLPGPALRSKRSFRAVRSDATGPVDQRRLRPVNFDEARRDTLRWGFDFTKPLRSGTPAAGADRPVSSQARRRRRASGGHAAARGALSGRRVIGRPPPTRGWGARGGPGRLRRFGGGRQGGRLTCRYHTVNLSIRVTIRPGVPDLALYYTARARVERRRPATRSRRRRAGEQRARRAAVGRLAQRHAGRQRGRRSLRFSPFTTFDLRLFANPAIGWNGRRSILAARHPAAVRSHNLFNAKPGSGHAPAWCPTATTRFPRSAGADRQHSLRKLFLPPRSFFRDQRTPSR